MAIIDITGLLRGKRLRKCSAQARLYWPYLFLLANGYARIELDCDSIADEFASFRDQAPNPTQIKAFFDEYEKFHLIFVFSSKDQRWGQWDTKRTNLKDFKTADDKNSPPPPEPEYSQWLEEHHGGDWQEYHWNKSATKLSPKTQPTVVQDSPKPSETVDQHLPRGVGVGVGSGVGVGLGNGKTKPSSAALTRKREKEPDPIVRTIYEIYPRRVARAAAYQAIRKAIARVIKEKGCSREDAGDFLYAAVAKFASSPSGQKGEHTPHCATFMNQDRFFDDAEQWWQVTNGNSNSDKQNGVIAAAAAGLARDVA